MGLFLQISVIVFRYICLPYCFIYFGLKTLLKMKRKAQNSVNHKKKIAFFHPYWRSIVVLFLDNISNSAGGGEKVLWCLIYSLFTHMKYIDEFQIVIYTGDTESAEDILQKASSRFNVNLMGYIDRIIFVRVSGRKLLEPFGFATMVLQMLGTMIYTLKCLWEYQPDVFFDSTGFGFAYMIVKNMLNCRIISYTHYPFISSDMMKKVLSNQQSFNNRGFIASSMIFSKLKYLYYLLISWIYSQMGNYIDMTFTNSTWTNDHIRSLWKPCRKEKMITESIILYPPCNVSSLINTPKQLNKLTIQIMSFAQFRPEKDHFMQIRVFDRVFERLNEEERHSLSFNIVGSVRNEDDEQLVRSLEVEVKKRKLEDRIKFVKNPPFQELLKQFEMSDIGIHTMKDEHFGIAVVEMMAGGLITIAHKSAGPLKDIIQTEKYGFLCENEDEYVESLVAAIKMPKEERETMIKNGREKAIKFSDEQFFILAAAHIETFLEYYLLVEQRH